MAVGADFERLAAMSPAEREAVVGKRAALLKEASAHGLEPILGDLKGPVELQWLALSRILECPERLALAKSKAEARRAKRAEKRARKKRSG